MILARPEGREVLALRDGGRDRELALYAGLLLASRQPIEAHPPGAFLSDWIENPIAIDREDRQKTALSRGEQDLAQALLSPLRVRSSPNW
jgi:hypothetical protein